MVWSADIVELNRKISHITSQDRKLALLNKSGLVDPDIFIAQSNALASQLAEAKQQKARLLKDQQDDTVPKTQELIETLASLPEFLTAFDDGIFRELIGKIIVEGGILRFRLANGLELTEAVERRSR